MDKLKTSMAQEIAEAASAFEKRRTGHVPKWVNVVLSENTLVITLHEALTPAERALAKSPAGAARVQEFHRQLFNNSSVTLRKEIQRITGVEVREEEEGGVAVKVPVQRADHPVVTDATVAGVALMSRFATVSVPSGVPVKVLIGDSLGGFLPGSAS